MSCCCCCRRRATKGGQCQDVIFCVFAFIFQYMFLPAAIVFELAWSVLLASSSVKTFSFMLTGSHRIYFDSVNSSAIVDDQVVTGPELALGVVVVLCSGAAMAAYMWIRHRAKLTGRRGRLLPYTIDPESIPLQIQGVDHLTDELRRQTELDTFDAFVNVEDDVG